MKLTNKEFCEIRDQLNDLENEIVDMFARRILQGQREYGEWTFRDNRNMLVEALEENLDSSAYSCCGLIRAAKKERK